MLGNLYVTGASTPGGSNWDFRTIKYNGAGDTLWTRLYNGPGNSFDYAFDIVLDDSANVYVTGSSIGIGTSRDFATIKYNTDGTQQWLIRYNNNPPGNAEDIPNSLAIDNQKNVYVTGTSDRGGLNYDYATIKYSQITEIVQINSQVPKRFGLFQNYPNPFNPTTKFQFKIPKRTMTRLIIYDAVGRELETIINKELKPGVYEAIWNASKYSTGVYFYQLISDGNIIETKKMIVLK